MERRDARAVDDHHVLARDAAGTQRAQDNDADGGVLQPAHDGLDLPQVETRVVAHVQQHARGDLRRVQEGEDLPRERQVRRARVGDRPQRRPERGQGGQRGGEERGDAVEEEEGCGVEEGRLRRQVERGEEGVGEGHHVVQVACG